MQKTQNAHHSAMFGSLLLGYTTWNPDDENFNWETFM